MNSSNFSELYSRIQDWSADDEDILLRKLKSFTENYNVKLKEVYKNIENIGKNINLIEAEYNNTSIKLKNSSIKQFMEHIVDTSEISNEEVKQKRRENPVIFSKEERERNILSKFKESIGKSLENLNIKSLIDIKENNDNSSILDDDNISVSSSKYLANLQKQKSLNLKLPYIIGTIDYFKNEYLGVSNNSSLLHNLSYTSSFKNNSTSNNIMLDNKMNNILGNLNFETNNNGSNDKVDNLDKLSMNMNIIEKIYDKKNSLAQPVDEESQLNELLFKNKKKDWNKPNNEDVNNPFNIYNNYMKNNTTIKDPNFVDFTKMNNFPNNNFNPLNYNIVVDEQSKPNDLEDSEKINPFLTNDNMENKITPNEHIISSHFSNLNKRVSLDNFLKKGNLFNGNLHENEDEDDNIGIFDNKNQGKFNLILKNKNNTLFRSQEFNIENEKESEETEFERIVDVKQIKSDEKINKEIVSVKTEKVENNFKKLDNLLNLLNVEENSDAIQTNKIEKEILKEENSSENKKKDKFVLSRQRNTLNNNISMNLFISALNDEDDEVFKKISNVKKKEDKIKKDNIKEEDKKTNLLKAKNTLKMLFNEDDDEENFKNPLDEANKINQKYSNLNEKISNILNNEKEDETDLLFIKPQMMTQVNETKNIKIEKEKTNKTENTFKLFNFEVDELTSKIENKNAFQNIQNEVEQKSKNLENETKNIFEDIFSNIKKDPEEKPKSLFNFEENFKENENSNKPLMNDLFLFENTKKNDEINLNNFDFKDKRENEIEENKNKLNLISEDLINYKLDINYDHETNDKKLFDFENPNKKISEITNKEQKRGNEEQQAKDKLNEKIEKKSFLIDNNNFEEQIEENEDKNIESDILKNLQKRKPKSLINLGDIPNIESSKFTIGNIINFEDFEEIENKYIKLKESENKNQKFSENIANNQIFEEINKTDDFKNEKIQEMKKIKEKLNETEKINIYEGITIINNESQEIKEIDEKLNETEKTNKLQESSFKITETIHEIQKIDEKLEEHEKIDKLEELPKINCEKINEIHKINDSLIENDKISLMNEMSIIADGRVQQIPKFDEVLNKTDKINILEEKEINIIKTIEEIPDMIDQISESKKIIIFKENPINNFENTVLNINKNSDIEDLTHNIINEIKQNESNPIIFSNLENQQLSLEKQLKNEEIIKDDKHISVDENIISPTNESKNEEKENKKNEIRDSKEDESFHNMEEIKMKEKQNQFFVENVSNKDDNINQIITFKGEDKRRSIKIRRFSEIKQLLAKKVPQKVDNENILFSKKEISITQFREQKKISEQCLFQEKVPDIYLEIGVVKNKKKKALKKFKILETNNQEELIKEEKYLKLEQNTSDVEINKNQIDNLEKVQENKKEINELKESITTDKKEFEGKEMRMDISNKIKRENDSKIDIEKNENKKENEKIQENKSILETKDSNRENPNQLKKTSVIEFNVDLEDDELTEKKPKNFLKKKKEDEKIKSFKNKSNLANYNGNSNKTTTNQPRLCNNGPKTQLNFDDD